MMERQKEGRLAVIGLLAEYQQYQVKIHTNYIITLTISYDIGSMRQPTVGLRHSVQYRDDNIENTKIE